MDVDKAGLPLADFWPQVVMIYMSTYIHTNLNPLYHSLHSALPS